MIQRLKNGKGAVARFGHGTVRIRGYTLATRFGGQIELTQIVKGRTHDPRKEDVVPDSNKIVLDFESISSLDTLIENLQNLRNDLVNEQG